MGMKNKEEKLLQSERIFEALSGVDEELLYRSEKKKNNIITFKNIGIAAAACVGLLVFGSVAIVSTTGGVKQAISGSAPMSFAPKTEDAAGACMEEAVEMSDYCTNNVETDDYFDVEALEETGDTERSEATSIQTIGSSIDGIDKVDLRVIEEMKALNFINGLRDVPNTNLVNIAIDEAFEIMPYGKYLSRLDRTDVSFKEIYAFKTADEINGLYAHMEYQNREVAVIIFDSGLTVNDKYEIRTYDDVNVCVLGVYEDDALQNDVFEMIEE